MKTLIAYATKYGTAAKLAMLIKEKLGDEVAIINLKYDPKPNLTYYDRVIMGSSVYKSKPRKELKNFIVNHLSSLLKKKVGLFFAARELDNAAQQKAIENTFPKNLRDRTMSIRFLGHAIDIHKVNPFERIKLKLLKNITKSYETFYDEEIDLFVKEISE